MGEEWEKQKLLRLLVKDSVKVFEKAGTNDFELLKNLLFKSAECNFFQTQSDKQAKAELYTPH